MEIKIDILFENYGLQPLDRIYIGKNRTHIFRITSHGAVQVLKKYNKWANTKLTFKKINAKKIAITPVEKEFNLNVKVDISVSDINSKQELLFLLEKYGVKFEILE